MESLSKRDVLVYSCGSLFTSIVPCLTLRGLATAISTSPSLKAKVLLRELPERLGHGLRSRRAVNSDNDRETPKYTASEYASTILEMLRRYDKPRRPHVITSDQRASRLITHVVYLEGGNVRLDETAMRVCPDLIALSYREDEISLTISRAWAFRWSKCRGTCSVWKMGSCRFLLLMPSSGP